MVLFNKKLVSSTILDFDISGEFLYYLESDDTVRVLNIINLFEVDKFGSTGSLPGRFNGAKKIAVNKSDLKNKYIYVLDNNGYLSLFKNKTFLKRAQFAQSIDILLLTHNLSSYIAIAFQGEIKLYDLYDFTSFVDSIVVTYGFSRFCSDGRYIYYSDAFNNLYKYDAINKTQIESVAIGFQAVDLYCDGEYIYIPYSSGIKVYSSSNIGEVYNFTKISPLLINGYKEYLISFDTTNGFVAISKYNLLDMYNIGDSIAFGADIPRSDMPAIDDNMTLNYKRDSWEIKNKFLWG